MCDDEAYQGPGDDAIRPVGEDAQVQGDDGEPREGRGEVPAEVDGEDDLAPCCARFWVQQDCLFNMVTDIGVFDEDCCQRLDVFALLCLWRRGNRKEEYLLIPQTHKPIWKAYEGHIRWSSQPLGTSLMCHLQRKRRKPKKVESTMKTMETTKRPFPQYSSKYSGDCGDCCGGADICNLSQSANKGGGTARMATTMTV